MVKNAQTKSPGAICLLVINRIPQMPNIALSSILNTTTESVHIGYVNFLDVEEFASNPRVILVDLSKEYTELQIRTDGNRYTGWNNDEFFRIVQMKWVLLRYLLSFEFEFVIYSDLDVIWSLDAYAEIASGFEGRPEVSIQIQSFSRSISEPRLCMGFVALKNDKTSHAFVSAGGQRHADELVSNPRLGDDDVATMLYIEAGFPEWLLELPQTTFPVGVSINLFRGKNVFPGLKAQEPFIFHANFAVGLNNKLLLMKTFLTHKDRKILNVKFSFKERITLFAKRVKNTCSLRNGGRL
jgi:hypothetical protein